MIAVLAARDGRARELGLFLISLGYECEIGLTKTGVRAKAEIINIEELRKGLSSELDSAHDQVFTKYFKRLSEWRL